MFEIEEIKGPVSRVKVFGVGGWGCNVINGIAESLFGAGFIAVNTGVRKFNYSLPYTKIQIGKELTKGFGTGGDPEKGRLAALEDKAELMSCLGRLI